MHVPPHTTRLYVRDAAGRRRTLLFSQTVSDEAEEAASAVVTTIRTEDGFLVRSLGANQFQVEATGEMLRAEEETV